MVDQPTDTLTVVRHDLVLRPAASLALKLSEWQTPSIRGIAMRGLKNERPDLYLEAFTSIEEAPLSVVVHTPFPNPLLSAEGGGLPIRLTAYGPRAHELAGAAEHALLEGVATCGVGPDRVLLHGVAGIVWQTQIDLVRVLAAPSEVGAGQRVRVEAPWPLVMRDKRKRNRPLVNPPLWGDFHNAAVNILARAARYWCGRVVPRSEESPIGAVAAGNWFEHRYDVHSSATETRRPVKGLGGWAVFAGVPASQAARVRAAGLLHIGEERRDGGGRMRVT